MRLIPIFSSIILTLFAISSHSYGRSVFLNGKDVSSAAGKKLEGVNISIAENGDVYISAPQYHVLEEVSYIPLGTEKKDPPALKRDETPARLGTSDLPDTPASNLSETGKAGIEEKPGSKASR